MRAIRSGLSFKQGEGCGVAKKTPRPFCQPDGNRAHPQQDDSGGAVFGTSSLKTGRQRHKPFNE
jgi:hypothetical protein